MFGHGSRRLGLLTALMALGVTSMSAGTFDDGSARQGTPMRAISTHARATQAPDGVPSRTTPDAIATSRQIRPVAAPARPPALPVASPHAASQRLALAPSGQVLASPAGRGLGRDSSGHATRAGCARRARTARRSSRPANECAGAPADRRQCRCVRAVGSGRHELRNGGHAEQRLRHSPKHWRSSSSTSAA